MTHGREGMPLGPMNGGAWCGGGAETAAPLDALRLLAAFVEGARAPVITGGIATMSAWIPFDILDDLPDCVAGLGSDTIAAGPPDASGIWSGVLLPMLREAGRLLPEVFYGIGDVVAAPGGGYRITCALPLAAHDHLALWAANLDLVEHLVDRPAPPPVLPLAALDLGVPQEMAAIVRDLYAAQVRPEPEAPEAPDHLSAA